MGLSRACAHQEEPGKRSNLSAFNIVGLLKTYTNQKDLVRGSKLHAYIEEHNFLTRNCFVANTLVSMYARCCAFSKAQQVLEEFSERDVVTWTALIAGYAQQGQGEEALKCFDSMQQEGHIPDAFTFTCVLKACGSIGALARGQQIYEMIVSSGMLGKDVVLGNTAVDMFAKCGAFAKAQQVLEELPFCNMVTWNALIAGYVEHGQGQEALNCFDSMQRESQSPDAITFICALKACGSIGAAAKGEEIYHKIVNLGLLDKNALLGCTLVDMYARCGALAKAQQVLEELPIRDMVTWNALIAGYAQHGQPEAALKCFDNMQYKGYSADAVTFTCALKACGSIGAVVKGKQIHDKIVSLGMLEKNLVLGNALVDMYARCGALAKAQQVCEENPEQDVVTWNALIAGYAQQGQGEAALKLLDSMQHGGHHPDAVTFTSVLKACGNMGAAGKGEKIHDRILSLGMLEKNIVLGNTLVDMYARCGALAKAQKTLEELPARDVVTWNALIAGYAQQGQGEKALKCFESMKQEGHSPDAITFISALKACGNIGVVGKGEQIHDLIVNLGMLEKDVVLGSTLVDMYARCGALAKAQHVLEELPLRDVITWNALIAGYTQQEQGEEALKCFDSMQCMGYLPNAVTFTCVLRACGSIGAAAKGQQIHEKIVSLGILEKNIVLWNTLVDMYARCGALAKAQEVFKEIPAQDVVTWNALIGGYVLQGKCVEAVKCFESMQSKGVKPNSTTLICALKACSHSGLSDKAEILFSAMRTKYGIIPDLEHYCCLIDLFGRAGMFNKALDVIEAMPSPKYLPVWVALLGACQKWGEVKLGMLAFKRACHLDKSKPIVTRERSLAE